MNKILDKLMELWGKVETLLETGLLFLQQLIYSILPRSMKEGMEKKKQEREHLLEQKEKEKEERKKKRQEEMDAIVSRLLEWGSGLGKNTWTWIKQAYFFVAEFHYGAFFRQCYQTVLGGLRLSGKSIFFIEMTSFTLFFWGFISLGILFFYGKHISISYQKYRGTYVDPRPTPIPYDLKNPRPAYENFDSHSFMLLGLRLPFYRGEQVYVNWVTFSIRASNKYILVYVDRFKERITDYLFSHMLPFDVDFLGTVEGKAVLKEKVKVELNRFLKEKKIRGEIVSVDLDEIIIMD